MNLVLLLILVPVTTNLTIAPHNISSRLRHLRRSLQLLDHFSNKPNMSRSSAAPPTVELDFLGIGTTTKMGNHHHRGGDTFSSSSFSSSPKSQFQKFLERERSFRGIRGGALAREVIPNLLSSEVLKCVIATRKSAIASSENVLEKPKTKPMTIFYGGRVSVHDVTPDEFESIVKLAMEEKFKAAGAGDRPQEPKQQQLVNLEDPLDEDLPIARRKSLQRFLEKRKERMNTVSPYGCHTNY